MTRETWWLGLPACPVTPSLCLSIVYVLEKVFVRFQGANYQRVVTDNLVLAAVRRGLAGTILAVRVGRAVSVVRARLHQGQRAGDVVRAASTHTDRHTNAR